MSLIMTCCDLSDQVRSWPTSQNVAVKQMILLNLLLFVYSLSLKQNLVYSEFFAQGDLEKQMGLAPNQMMDRQNACIPELQLEFIGTVVRPTYEMLCSLFPQTSLFLTSIDENKKQWEAIRTTFTNCNESDSAQEN